MAKLNETIDVLEKGGNITLNGLLFQEDEDSITVQVGGSLIDIPKQHVLSRRDVDAASGRGTARIVDVTIDKEAKVLQRIPVAASALATIGGGFGEAAACACACECNCACDCACGSSVEMAQFLRTMAFRNPMIPRNLRAR